MRKHRVSCLAHFLQYVCMQHFCRWSDREVRMEPEIIIKEMETELKDIVARLNMRASGASLIA